MVRLRCGAAAAYCGLCDEKKIVQQGKRKEYRKEQTDRISEKVIFFRFLFYFYVGLGDKSYHNHLNSFFIYYISKIIFLKKNPPIKCYFTNRSVASNLFLFKMIPRGWNSKNHQVI